MEKIVDNYKIIKKIDSSELKAFGDSASPRGLIFHILKDNSESVNVLDIGFGAGKLGLDIKNNSKTAHWQVDGIDGWAPNCQNVKLFEKNIYRNIWLGYAEEISETELSQYKILCLLDVIEHLDVEKSKSLIQYLLGKMNEDAFLFISTPLWFYPQDQQQEGDLEEHKIGVPATSMFAMIPVMYAFNNPLIGGFVYSKKSAAYADLFNPTANKGFNYEMGLTVLKALNINPEPGVCYKVGESK